MNPLSLRGLTKSHGRAPVLRGIDLDVAAGEVLALLGASGSGKTTLLRLVAGFDVPDAGTVRLAGREVAGRRWVPARHRGVGYVPQEGALFPHLDVAANVGFGLPRGRRTDRLTIDGLLDVVGLDRALARRQPHELSGGQQQRVALARALAPRPALVLLDEPFSSLDAGLRAETRSAVAAAIRAVGAAAVLVTHDQAEALSTADRVAVIDGGRILQVDTPERLYTTPTDVTAARFVGEGVLLPARASSGTASCVLGTVALRSPVPEGDVRLLIRPEDVLLTDASGVPARVRGSEFRGHETLLELSVGHSRSGGDLVLLVRLPGRSTARAGDLVHVEVPGPVHHLAPGTP